jgi:hypothetical protein
MSVEAPPAEVGNDTSAPATSRQRWRGRLLWGALLAGTVVALGLLTLGTPPRATAFDPDAATPTGSRALARVLADHGVEVDVVRRIDDLEGSAPDADTTIVVSAPNLLGEDALVRLRAAARPAARLVLVLPRQQVLDGLDLTATSRLRSVPGTPGARCGLPLLRPGEGLSRSTASYEVEGAGWRTCFTDGAVAGLVAQGLGSGHETWVLGFGGILQNESVVQQANAAAAIRLLGGSDRLVWYHPGAADAADAATGQPKGLRLPDWFDPLVTLLAFGVALLALIRGRRLGRVVTEPLPVVVRASETTEGRGRLYRRANERARSVEILRAGTIRRLSHRLGLPRGVWGPERSGGDEESLVDATARASGLSPERIRAILLDPVDDSDAALLRCAQQLTELEDKVSHP